ncbi:putative transposase [Gordonia sputi NBRC 100414]|uniref:Putative transposase n=1 Tax=Gordonia sputi NBRC 100414 TaxID=1089453 RepID=H5TVP2_9ACTN|nr:putative transposase [Gordonia sputi NBRC 100414]
MHTVIDDHSRVAYTEVHDDETAVTAVTAVAVLRRAVQWFAGHGVTIERVLSDNGGAYRSHLWRDTCEALSITPKRTRPYRPQTNGKVERFHRTMATGGPTPAATPASKNAATRSSRGWGTTTKCGRTPRAITIRHSPNSERLATLRRLRRPRQAAPR